MKRTVSTLTIELTVQGDPSDAVAVVDSILDNGTFQDAINEYASVQVRSAVVRSLVVTQLAKTRKR